MSKYNALAAVLILSTALVYFSIPYGEASVTDDVAFSEKQPRWSYQTVGTVNVVEVSPNGAYVILGTSDGYAYLFDADSDVPLDAASIGDVVRVVGVSYYGKYLAVAFGGETRTLNMYSITSNRLEFMWSFVNDPVRDRGGFHSLAFSSDGSLLVAGTWGYDDARTYVHLFDVATGSTLWSYLVKEYTSSKYDYVSVDISSDGQYIVAGSTYTHNTYLFRYTNSTPLHTYSTGSAVNSVSISPDGEYFAVASSMVYYFKNGVSVPQWSHDLSGTVNSISISSNAVYIAAATGNYFYLLRNDNSIFWSYKIGEGVGPVSFSTNGEYIVTRSGNYIHVFSTSVDGNPSTPTHDPVWSYDTKAVVNSVSISSDGRYTVAGSGTYTYSFDMTYDPDLNPTHIQFSDTNVTDGDTITISATIKNRGNLDSPNAFVKFYDGTILMGLAQTGTISHDSRYTTVSIGCTLSPSGVHIIKVMVDPDDLIYESNENNNDLTKAITLNSFPFEDTGANPVITDVTQSGTVNSISISGNGYYTVLGTSDSYAYLLFRNHTSPIWSYSADGSINIASLSKDGSYIALTVGNTLSVFSRTNSKPLWSFVNDPVRDRGGFHSLAFSSDGSLLVAGTWGYDDARTYVHLFDVATGSTLWSYLVKEYTSSKYDYVSVDISSDGQYIVAGSTYTHNTYLFDSRNAALVYFYSTAAEVNSVAMSFDGDYFVCGGNRVYYFNKDVIVPLWSHDIGGTVSSVSMSSDSAYVAASREAYVFLLKKDKTELWNYEIATLIGQTLISDDGNYVAVRGGNSAYLFSSTIDGNITTTAHDPIWSYETGNTVNSLSISRDGRYTIFCSGGSTFLFDMQHKADLMPTGITFSKDIVNEGDLITISATINNTGVCKSYYTNISFFDGQRLIDSRGINPVLPNSSTVASVTYLCEIDNNHTIRVIVDPFNRVWESNKTNNQLAATIHVNLRPNPVTAYNPSDITSSSLKITWTENMEVDFAEYQIYQSTMSGQIGSLVGTIQDQETMSYNVSGLKGSTTYYFTIRVVDTNDAFSDSNQVEGTTLPTPVVLHELTDYTISSLSLSWTRNADSIFERYEVYMSEVDETLGSLIASFVDQTVTTHNVTGLGPSTRYYFTVRIVNPQGLHSDSNQVNGTTLSPPPISPVTLNNPANPKPNSLDLSWTQNTEDNFLRYEIYISTSPEEVGTIAETVTDQSSTAYTVTGLDASTTYYFVVRVVDTEGIFSDSNEVGGMTLPTPAVLHEPTERTESSLLLSWTLNTDSNFERYEIYSSTGQYGDLITSFGNQSTTTYNVTGLAPSTKYYFVVRVVNSEGGFSNSNEINCTTLGGPLQQTDWTPYLWVLGIITIVAGPTIYLLRRRRRKVYPSPAYPKKKAKKKKGETEIYGKPGPGAGVASIRLPSGEIRCLACGFINSSKAKYCRNCSSRL